jgi:hypothetical protein
MRAVRTLVLAASLVAAGSLAGCGGSDAGTTTAAAPAALSVAEAKRLGAGEPRRIRGYLVQRPNAYPHLCASLRETEPPSCGGAFLVYEGPDPAAFGYALEQKAGTQWTAQPVVMTGVLRENATQLFIEEQER